MHWVYILLSNLTYYDQTFPPTLVLSVVSVLPASVLSVSSLLQPRHHSKSTHFTRVSTSTPLSLVPVSRNCARTSSAALLSPSRRFSVTQRSIRATYTKSSSLVVQLVSRALSSSYLTSSTARSPTSQSTPMRPLHTVQLSRRPFFLVTPLRRRKTCSCWMSPLFRSVSRPLVVS